MRRGFRRPSGAWWQGAIVAGAAIGALTTVFSAIQVVRSRGRVRETALASLRNYASVATEQFTNGFEALLRQGFLPSLPPSMSTAGISDELPGISRLVELRRQLAQDPCRCNVVPTVTALFRVTPSGGEAVDSSGRLLPPPNSSTQRAIRTLADSLRGKGWGYAYAMLPSDTGVQFLVLTSRAGPLGGSYSYGMSMSPAQLADQLFAPTLLRNRLVPRHLLATVPNNRDYVEIEVTTPDGQSVYSSGSQFRAGPADALHLPPLRGPVVVKAWLNPALKDALVPGGIPSPLPLRDLAVLGLTLVFLLGVTWLALRAISLARLRADFASSVTHELRTPLTQIRLAAETLALGRSKDADSAGRSLASIVAESTRLQQLIDNVLHYSRAERKSIRVRADQVELRALVAEVIGGFAPMVAGRSLGFGNEVSPNLTVLGDSNALRQILLNLLDNAARYGPDASVITVGAAPRDAEVDLWVEDRGPGISASDRARVWRPFVRLDTAEREGTTGTGLGLAVVAELVQAQGGRCWIEAGSPRGARVVMRLPAPGARA